MARLLVFLVSLGVRALRAICRSRADLVIENLALHQQVAALIKQRARPALDDADRAFWVALRAVWPRWVNRLIIVEADTVAKCTMPNKAITRPSSIGQSFRPLTHRLYDGYSNKSSSIR